MNKNEWDFTKSYLDLPKEFSDCIALKGECFVEEIHQMVGFMSTLMAGKQTFDTRQALGLSNELCLLARKYEELQERESAFRNTLIMISLGHEKCFGQSHSSAYTTEELAREILARYPEELK